MTAGTPHGGWYGTSGTRSRLLLVALALALGACAPRGNLVPDPGFERGASRWQAPTDLPAGARADWAPAAGRAGSGALHLAVDDSASAARAVWRCELVRVVAEADVRFSAWVRATPGHTLPVLSASALARDGSVRALETTAGTAPTAPDTGWVLIGATLRTWPSVHRIRLELRCPDPGEAWVDDVVAEPVGTSDPR